jgi:hypothetical protein
MLIWKALSYSFPQTSHWAIIVFSFLPKQDNSPVWG